MQVQEMQHPCSMRTCCIPRQHILRESVGIFAQEEVHVLAGEGAEGHRHLCVVP